MDRFLAVGAFLSQLCYFAFRDLNILSNDFDNECKNANLLILAHVQLRETCPTERGQVSYFAFLLWEHMGLAHRCNWTAFLMMLGCSAWFLFPWCFIPLAKLKPSWTSSESDWRISTYTKENILWNQVIQHRACKQECEYETSYCWH